MGLLKDIFSNPANAGGIFGTIGSIINNERNIKLQKESNKQQLAENERNRVFNAEEAERQRDFTEDFYQKYESPSAMVAQYQAAGLNPALMMQNGANFGASQNSGAASSSAASVGDAPQSDPFGNFSAAAQGIGNIVGARLNEVKRQSEELERDLSVQTFGVRKDLLFQELENKKVHAALEKSNIDVNETKVAINKVDSKLKNLDYVQRVETFKDVIQAIRLDNALKDAKVSESREATQNLRKQRDEIEAHIKQMLSAAALNDEERAYVSKNFHLDELKTDFQRYMAFSSVVNSSKGNRYGSIGFGKTFKLAAGGTTYKGDIISVAFDGLGFTEVDSPEKVNEVLNSTQDLTNAYIEEYANSD